MSGGLEAGTRRGCVACRMRLCVDGYCCVFGVRGGVERKEYCEDETRGNTGADAF